MHLFTEIIVWELTLYLQRWQWYTVCLMWWKHCISNAPLLHPREHTVLLTSSCAMNRPMPRWNWHLCYLYFVISSKGECQGRVLLFFHAYKVRIRIHTILYKWSLFPENSCSRISLNKFTFWIKSSKLLGTQFQVLPSPKTKLRM